MIERHGLLKATKANPLQSFASNDLLFSSDSIECRQCPAWQAGDHESRANDTSRTGDHGQSRTIADRRSIGIPFPTARFSRASNPVPSPTILVTTSIRLESSGSSTEKLRVSSLRSRGSLGMQSSPWRIARIGSTQFADGSRTIRNFNSIRPRRIGRPRRTGSFAKSQLNGSFERESQIESIQRIDRLEPSQRRSFQDELRSINLEPTRIR